ncbi:hypothetical protein HK097_009761 [Rhizophlyctis rosea]|uniref:N-acetyltransferase domain-containing protein n=1 Tax=Rhizophlyctis rosea TaxID=64517 RepID=A0AAD5SA17_9FUNG|nr:hypothetical protein HK097_009761 [Rhizophlyctis rosea]
MPPFIRLYASTDHAAIERICLLTANNGTSAEGIYTLGENLMANLFAHPYTHFHPDLAFVLDNGEGEAVGYILGTPDTPAFVQKWSAEWIEKFPQYPPTPMDLPTPTPDEIMLGLFHHPERLILPEVADYPAHLHIDLLPPFQGKGWGREFMKTFLGALKEKGVEKVHLSMVTANVKARGFYDRMGFEVIEVPEPGVLTYLGRRTEWKEQ